jgi:hypothetical protein
MLDESPVATSASASPATPPPHPPIITPITPGIMTLSAKTMACFDLEMNTFIFNYSD